jgi:hypothetical protein
MLKPNLIINMKIVNGTKLLNAFLFNFVQCFAPHHLTELDIIALEV